MNAAEDELTRIEGGIGRKEAPVFLARLCPATFRIVVRDRLRYYRNSRCHWEQFMNKRKSASRVVQSTKRQGVRKVSPAGGDGTDEVRQSNAFQKASACAEVYAKDPERMRKLLSDAMEKINYVPRGPFVETWPYLLGMVRLIRAYHGGEYQDISSQHLHVIVAALIYFVSPDDAIPDSVPILGQLDDALVVRLALKTVAADIDTFMAWETVKI